MTYNEEFSRAEGNFTYKIFIMKDVQWGKKTKKRFFVEVWDDRIEDVHMALVEKREYKTKAAAQKRILVLIDKEEKEGSANG